MLSTPCLALPLSLSDFSGACFVPICISDLTRLFLLCNGFLHHLSKSIPQQTEERWWETYTAINSSQLESWELTPFLTCPGETFHPRTSSTFKTASQSIPVGVVLEQRNLTMLIYLGAALDSSAPTWVMTTACPHQLLYTHTHLLLHPSLCCSAFSPSLQQQGQHIHPCQRKPEGVLVPAPHLAWCLLPAGSRQAGPSAALAFGTLPRTHFLWSPGLFLQESLPSECISSRLFKSLAFSLLKWPAACWFSSQSSTWDHPLLPLILTVYLANFVIVTLSGLITAPSTLSLPAAQMTQPAMQGSFCQSNWSYVLSMVNLAQKKSIFLGSKYVAGKSATILQFCLASLTVSSICFAQNYQNMTLHISHSCPFHLIYIKDSHGS